MLLHIFVGSLLPYVEALDSWLFEGSLDDPFEEVIVIKDMFYIEKLRTVLRWTYKHPRSSSTLSKIDFI